VRWPDKRAEAVMSNTNEWNLLKHQFDALVHESVAAESIEQILDAEFRRRLAEVINQAAYVDDFIKGAGKADLA
jgi:hypothetical protein